MKKVKSLFIIVSLLFSLFLVSCNGECEHDYEVSAVNIEVTCLTDGEVVKKCTKCGDTVTETVVAVGHQIQEATCYEVKHCTVCFEKFGTELTDHVYGEWYTHREATCEVSGSERRKCTLCGQIESKSINALGHDYSDWDITIEATCDTDGSREKICSICNDKVIEPIKGEHQFGEWEILQNPTCQNIGLRSHECDKCDHVEREEIPVSDHSYEEWEIMEEATCTSEGTEKNKCINCDAIITRSTPKAEHNFSDWENIEDALCSKYGLKTHECSVCHKVEEQLIEKLDHQYETIDGAIICSICHNNSEVYESLKAIFDKLVLDVDDKDGIVLPSEINEYEIKWQSLNHSIALDDGTVYARAKGEKVVYKALVEINGNICEFMKEVEIPNIDISSIEWCWSSYYGKKVPEQIATDMRYQWKNYANDTCSVVGYESSNTNIMTHDGEIFQQVYDQYVTVTCHLKIGKVIGSFTRDVKVLGFTPNQRLEMVVEWLPTVIEQIQNNERNTLPLTHELYGTSISWFSLEAGVVAGNGVFVRPTEQKDIMLNCTVTSGMYVRDLEFQLEAIGGNTTEFDQLREWIKGQIPSRILGTRNYVLANDAFDYQIRTNDHGVLNLIDGTLPVVDRSMLIDINKAGWKNQFWGSRTFNTDLHPSVPQSILDKMLYTGYQNPNPENILWITVHESGMPRVGNDALLLAKVQMESALGLRDRAASWNYQVDENVIYQSFEDEVICWHAGDGTAALGNGNNNSIGIEMCINEDGNYDGAMHMDAKLIAMLLHKYNLTLENVKRHYDWSGKICPNYMIVTGRWNEFLNLVDKEYTAMKLLKDANVTWTVTTDDNQNTEEVLKTYFTKGGSTLWFSKKVYEKVTLHITMTVELKGEVFTHSNDLTLYPNV